MSERFSLEKLSHLPEVQHPVVSPRGDEVGMFYDVTGENEFHLLDVESNERTRVTDGNSPRNATPSFVWNFPDREIVFTDDRTGGDGEDIVAVNYDAEIEILSETSGSCNIVDYTRDYRTFLYTCSDDDAIDLYEYDRASDTTTQITGPDQFVRTGKYGPDADRIAYTAYETDNPRNRSVYVADGSETRRLDVGEVGSRTSVGDWHPDGRQLLLMDNATGKSSCGVYDVEDDRCTWYSRASDVEFPQFFLPDGSGFLATRVRECAIEPIAYDLETGRSRELDLPSGRVSFPRGRKDAFLADDVVVLLHETADRRPTVLEYDLETDRAETLLEPTYGGIDPEAFVDCDYVTFESHDGIEIEGLVYDSGVRPSPVVVQIHGGPDALDARSFDPLTQCLVSRGYTVFQVNYRGSTGRGREFRELLAGEMGDGEQGDIAEGAKWLAEKDWIDEDRIAVFGDSYGGYSAYMQLVRYPDVYAAGAAWGGLADLVAAFEAVDRRYKDVVLRGLGDPEDNEGLLRERSPITHVSNLESPLCIIHGTDDRIVPISQMRTFKETLEEHGYTEGTDGDFEYYEFAGEDHKSVYGDQKLRLFRTLTDFFERRL